jgi:phosphoribosylformylglycinamidine synthase
VHDDVRLRVPSGFSGAGDRVMLLGTTREELGGSLWAHVAHGHLGGRPPSVDLAGEQALAQVLVAAARRGLLAAAHDLSDGGLAVALAEACLAGGAGAVVTLPGDAFVWLFSESSGRVLCAVPISAEAALTELCSGAGVPVAVIGTVGGDALEVTGSFTIGLDELGRAHRATLPALFG